MGRARRIETAVFRWLRREPPQGFVHRAAFWLLAAYVALALLGFLPGSAGAALRGIAELDFFALMVFCVPLLWRFVFSYLLWKVRNRLIVTYLLMGLTPVVLFVTLAVILLYVFAGQFAIFAANGVVSGELTHIGAVNTSVAERVAHLLDQSPRPATVALPEAVPADREYAGLSIAVYQDGRPVAVTPASLQSRNPPMVPAWLPRSFSSIVFDRGRLWLRAASRLTLDGHTTVAITSVPFEKQNVDSIASGLGSVSIFATADQQPESASRTSDRVQVHLAPGSQPNVESNGVSGHSITGGTLPPARHFYDVPVTFPEPLTTVNWKDDASIDGVYAYVTSRPSLLYQRLFITSLAVGAIVRDALITIAVLFGVLELLAFLAAVRLNHTITRSVDNLYAGTVAIDGGNFAHRIPVKRRDQLGALSRSFNDMAASLERLIAEQREKQRLQSELAIAQEVQANLFPHGQVRLPMLELHGKCVPARTVSGDYYDFVLSGESGLGLALGDISGKGISAALLMATLYSAVRAYRFAGEELMAEGAAALARPVSRLAGVEVMECGDLFQEPAKMLALLNHHLYRSTQPEKYATLFLAHYDGPTRRLVYSNGGQLPPLLLRADDTVTRLDCGGMVVGLLDNLTWEQGAEGLAPGDILIAYSDGVTEPENDFGEFGEERLLDLVRQHRHLPLDAISERVLQSLRSWIGDQEQPDDITLVLARQL
ncbi:MAG TPA: SpoIIE family protein phosphatase [Acidobacteriaceae bacterium]|nr:SpoIIE family protein phosphatase [Acidobacteriaceae bacterium]